MDGAEDTLRLGTGSGAIVTGGNNLTKVGPGTLELGGTAGNNYGGTTYVNAGTLAAEQDGRPKRRPGNRWSSATTTAAWLPTRWSTPRANQMTATRTSRSTAPAGWTPRGTRTPSTSLTIIDGSFVTNGAGNFQVNANPGLTMTGGSVATSGGATFVLNNNMTANYGAQAVISGKLSLNNGDLRQFNV